MMMMMMIIIMIMIIIIIIIIKDPWTTSSEVLVTKYFRFGNFFSVSVRSLCSADAGRSAHCTVRAAGTFHHRQHAHILPKIAPSSF
jgi:hypothetical protein